MRTFRASIRSGPFAVVVVVLLVLFLWTETFSQERPPDSPHPDIFKTADQCMACHNGLVTDWGEDISIGSDWRASMMANSARDPYWQAAVRREVTDHPAASAEIQNECSRCHMPMSTFEANLAGREGEVFSHLPAHPASGRADRLAADGVSCTTCHQITDENLGTRASFVGHFRIDTTKVEQRTVYGPFEVDSGRSRIMHSASGFEQKQGLHVQSSELCATCHTLYTNALGPDGEVIGELPEQVPYLEWRHSDYRGEQSCQSCHMPVVEEPTEIASVMGQERDSVSRHVFRGGNFFMLRMLNRYRSELGVEARPQELFASAHRTVEHLKSEAATVTVEDVRVREGRLTAEVEVTNLAGHKLPTAYPSRRSWLHVTVLNRRGETVFESGRFREDGSIAGNDNDVNADRYEPHYRTISSEEEVQIYEAIMTGPDGEVTTGLLTATQFVKDNRILPRGFEKETAGEDIAVQGAAFGDPDFRGGSDRMRYEVDVSDEEAPFSVKAELWYQPIAYRWARNLDPYDTEETDRFVGYFESMSEISGIVVASGSARTSSTSSRR